MWPERTIRVHTHTYNNNNYNNKIIILIVKIMRCLCDKLLVNYILPRIINSFTAVFNDALVIFSNTT
jgi:hypothetical protein